MEIEQVRAAQGKDSMPRTDGSSTACSTSTGSGEAAFHDGGSDPDLRGRGQTYVPPPFRGTRELKYLFATLVFVILCWLMRAMLIPLAFLLIYLGLMALTLVYGNLGVRISSSYGALHPIVGFPWQ